ncbi:nucleoside-diphosphate kinase [Pelolinea submarina]|uniref:Nucleoside diphosphate kinase n=1 Tax=Pelolinea submarina TaxID=913107 RepID=A0A347ZT33_9CHLR|nr:nucleoside-diphosphate kinase [Pelolinea submarina]REG10960.1 nucleoside diphosphate kinase [Pelolinea submarina]BBB48464.1 nucleoside-diphosphate kinase [Pelolinea submarina]
MINCQRTLVLIKPDGVHRGLIGEIISRLENRGLKLVAMEFRHITKEFAEEHYAAHKGKPFFNGLVKYITAAPLVAMVWEGSDAIKAVRQTVGATNPTEAAPGTIRHDLSILTSRNLIHASDSVESAEAEIKHWFKEEDIFPWERDHEEWITGLN